MCVYMYVCACGCAYVFVYLCLYLCVCVCFCMFEMLMEVCFEIITHGALPYSKNFLPWYRANQYRAKQFRTQEIFSGGKNWWIWQIVSYLSNFSLPIAFTCTVRQNFPPPKYFLCTVYVCDPVNAGDIDMYCNILCVYRWAVLMRRAHSFTQQRS